MTMNASIERQNADQTDWAFLKTEKGWRLAEKQWYCGDCGFVSVNEITVTDTDEADCRCGRKIQCTAF